MTMAKKGSFFWGAYNALFSVGYVLMLPRFLARMAKRGGYRRRFLERFGIYDDDVKAKTRGASRIWIHAVSVGEISAALSLVREIRRQDPSARFIVSTTTSTGRAVAEGRMDPQDALVYYPADFPPAVRKALDTLNPGALVLTESELWPNMLRMAQERGIPTILFNGRISESSMRGYRKIRPVMRAVMSGFAACLAQSEEDAGRLAELGAPSDRTRALASAKYDAAPQASAMPPDLAAFFSAAGVVAGTPVLLGASTWPGEEDALAGIYGRLREAFPGLRLALVPRHAERRREVAAGLRRLGFCCVLRSAGIPERVRGNEILVVDTTGELAAAYQMATVVVIGKTFLSRGGQNMIEPAALGKAVVVGPHVSNFETIVKDFLADGSMIQAGDLAELEQAVRRLLAEPRTRDELGRRAAMSVARRRGAVAESARVILDVLRQRGSSGQSATPA